jgi:dihydroorotate dehydrogenase (NAD+) catalytic subunit
MPVELRVRLGGLELPNPIIAASGTFGHGDEVARRCDPARLGAVTAKSQAPFEWAGNPPPRMQPTGTGLVNSVGLQGPGIDHWVAHELPALRSYGARVIASLWGHRIEDFGTAAAALQPVTADLVAVEVNVSCPNLAEHGRPFAHDAAETAAAVHAVTDAALGLPVFAKLAPDVADVPAIAGAALGAGADGLTLVNTARALLVDAELGRPVLGAGTGGLSGPPLKPIALRAVHEVAAAHRGVPIIGTGGVTSGVDAVELLLAGATAVGVGTATFLDPRATLRILDELEAWCEHHGVARVADLTGALRAADREETA